MRGLNRKFCLYELRTENEYSPLERDGIIMAGSGALAFEEAFDVEVRGVASQWAASYSSGLKVKPDKDGRPTCVPRHPQEFCPVNLDAVVTLIGSTVDIVVNRKDIATVGGLTQIKALDKNGIVNYMGFLKQENGGKWSEFTARSRDLRTDSEISNIPYDLPYMSKSGLIDSNRTWKSKV
jgi:hypothetical protein